MNIFELSRKSLIVMLLSLMALVMLPACSTTEEAPPPDSGGDTSTYDECIEACGSGDLNCRESCLQDAPI